HRKFLAETTTDDNGTIRPKHERLLKAENSLNILVRNGNLFTYLNDAFDFKCPSTNNRIEGGINAQLRAMLRNHRGMTIEKRIKAVFWWCYMHSPNPLSLKEILEVMPTNKSISTIYNTMNERSKLEASIPTWGDAIVWSDLHFYDKGCNSSWD
ncbi:MAG: IS256 family transposase, partial [Veillonella caviae]|nr:IS256 family transposase [Veillonella caviae]